jgi:hypothetical protein
LKERVPGWDDGVKRGNVRRTSIQKASKEESNKERKIK